MSIRSSLSFTYCLVSLLLVSSSAISDSKDNAANLDIKKVALFKNGTGFYYSEVQVPPGVEKFEFGQIPIPSQGTFWVAYPKSLKVDKLVARINEYDTTVSTNSFPDLMRANIGRSMRIKVAGVDTSTIAGTLIKLIYRENSAETPNPYFMQLPPVDTRNNPYNRYQYRYPQPSPNPMAEIRTTDDKTVIINTNSIVRMELSEGELNSTISQKTERPSIFLELDAPSNGETVSVNYLARGINWTPSYIIDISKPERAQFTAKAIVTNELIDLEHVDLSLVTGYPNIQFADVQSPIAMSKKLAAHISSMSSDFFGVEKSDILGQVMVRGGRAVEAEYEVEMPGYSAAEGGTVAEDLFLYAVGQFSLKVDETAYLPLFSEELPYKHLFTWSIPDILDEYERYNSTVRDQDERYGEIIWHIVRLENKTDFPITTASAEFVKDGTFVGQDVCYYTAPGEKADIRINRAMNVIAEKSEHEVERQRNAGEFYGWHFDLVTVKGELQIRNRMDKSITLEINKTLSGEVLSIDPAAEDLTIVKGLQRVNPRHNLIWTIELDGGEKINLNYEYEVYVRI